MFVKIVVGNQAYRSTHTLYTLYCTGERGRQEGGAYSGETAYWSMGAYSRKYGIPLSSIFETIVSRGDWLGNPANITVENNGAVDYVGSSLTAHNPLFSVHQF